MKQWSLRIEKDFLPSLMLLKENGKKMGMAQLGSKLTLIKRSSCEIISWWPKSLVSLVWALLLFSDSSYWVTTPQCFHEYGIRFPCFLLYSSHFILHALTLMCVAPYTCALPTHVLCRIKSTALNFGTADTVVFNIACFSTLHQLNVSFCL